MDTDYLLMIALWCLIGAAVGAVASVIWDVFDKRYEERRRRAVDRIKSALEA